ncbi:MAG: hypothetical protein JNN08_11665 [Bryobacterales bacterium]|nr:hypothetical protein [Bryobacterales bacterium]
MVQGRNGQMSLCDGFWTREVDDLWPAWMRVADRLLEDEDLIDPVYQAQGKRWRQSRTRGRKQTPAEVVLRMLVLKDANNWSFEETEHPGACQHRVPGVCAGRLVPRARCQGHCHDRQADQAGSRGQIHQRIVAMAKQAGAVKGQRMRVDTTVVEANIHYPTDSSLLGDGARVLTRLMKKVEAAVGGLAAGVRDRKERSSAKSTPQGDAADPPSGRPCPRAGHGTE